MKKNIFEKKSEFKCDRILNNEDILEAVKSLHNGKKRANKIEIFKRVQSIGITEEEVNNSLKLLQDVKIIEIKTIKGTKIHYTF